MDSSVKGVIEQQGGDEWVTIKVKKEVKNELLKIRSLLQFREGRDISYSEAIEFLINNCEIEIPSNGFIIPPKKRL